MVAELENFKKRKQQEVDTFKKYASESVVLEMLSILDTFDFNKCSYKECTRIQNELEKNGYTCNSGLDGQINDIKKI